MPSTPTTRQHSRPNCRIVGVKVPQLVAAQLQAIWADAMADALEYIRQHAVKRKHSDSIAAGI